MSPSRSGSISRVSAPLSSNRQSCTCSPFDDTAKFVPSGPQVAPSGAGLPGTDLDIPGLAPFVTPNASFYRVDTALVLPQVDPTKWQLRIHGMVEKEITLTFDELLKRPLIEDY